MPSPEISLPGPFETAPSPDLPVEPPWLRTFAEAAKFEQRVLYRRGPAQVGFDFVCPPFFTSPFITRVDLVPSHLRLTHPCGVEAVPEGRQRLAGDFSRR